MERCSALIGKFAETGLTAEDAKKLLKNPKVLEAMLARMREHDDWRLVNGLFVPLAEKLDAVRAYPDLDLALLDAAIAEYEGSARKARYDAIVGKPAGRLVDQIVTVYRESVPATVIYGRDRMRDAHGDNFSQWEYAYGKDIDDKRVRLLEGVGHNHPVNCVRIEVIDFGANWNRTDGFVPKDIRGNKSAHAGVIYAGAQNPSWVRAMDGENVPYALAGGYELNVPGDVEWTRVPAVWRYGAEAGLSDDWYGGQYREGSLPLLWE